MDYYYISYALTILALIITTVAQIYVNSSYSKYKKVKNRRGLTGAEAARAVLDKNGLQNVKIGMVRGTLSDHYDPRTKTVNLSSDIYNGTTIAGVSVACHECGHAIQDKENYTFMRIRSSLVPIVNFSSKLGYFAILLGIVFSSINLIWLGIFAEIAILLFQLVTLPVEFDASRKALKELDAMQILDNSEMRGSKTMLRSAALTYVASVTSTIIEIFRLILLAGNRNRD
ncbi:MAG: zinc metallopeptidase [bacterium]|nr:zinc metallopeptidase [bacterium]